MGIRTRGEGRGPRPRLPAGVALLLLAAPAGAAAQAGERPDAAATYLEVVASHFGLPSGEAPLLLEEGLAAEELPVLLLLARSSGLPPVAVLSRRARGDAQSARWDEIARQVGLDAGVFHVELPEDALDAQARRAVEPFRRMPPARWSELRIPDEQVIWLANVRTLARGLAVSEAEVVRARARADSWIGAVELLLGGDPERAGGGAPARAGSPPPVSPAASPGGPEWAGKATTPN